VILGIFRNFNEVVRIFRVLVKRVKVIRNIQEFLGISGFLKKC
jgi:hypothetical protein